MTLTIDPVVYLKLLEQQPPQPIHEDADYEKALGLVEAWIHEPNLSFEQEQLMEVWITLIEAYEKRMYQPGSASTPLSMLQHLMEARDLTQADLVLLEVGTKEVISEIMQGNLDISKSQAKTLGKIYNIDSNLFLS